MYSGMYVYMHLSSWQAGSQHKNKLSPKNSVAVFRHAYSYRELIINVMETRIERETAEVR